MTSLVRAVSRQDSSGSGDAGDHSTDTKQKGRASVKTKPSGACVHCKSLKVRCEMPAGSKTCQRCEAGNIECLPRSRKKRKAAPTHEDLQEKAHDQDRQIEALLSQFDQLKSKQRIVEWMARSTSAKSDDDLDAYRRSFGFPIHRHVYEDPGAEPATIAHFRTAPNFMNQKPPEVVKYCELYPEDINNLFTIFFEKVNPYFSILDLDLHTPGNLIWSSSFLFTVVVAVAARYYTNRPALYELAKDFARDAAGRALIDGSMGVDVCQAYLIMGIYPVPKKKWVEDRSWMLMGVAIRMALQLKLNEPPSMKFDERERLNRTRTWLNCFCVDGSHAIQFGKMPMLPLDDFVARNSSFWYKTSHMNTPFDVHLCAYVQLLLLMADWRGKLKAKHSLETPDRAGIIEDVLQTHEKLSSEMALWVEIYAQEYSLMPLPVCAYRGNTTQMISAYLRLVVLAVGFQELLKDGLTRDSEILMKSIEAAQTVIQFMVERLFPAGYLRYALEANFLYVAFAAAFLINLLRPKFLPLLSELQQKEIVRGVSQLITVLGSKDVALDGRHTPALYSRFLASLLAKYNDEPVIHEVDVTDPSQEQWSFADLGSWPDVGSPDPNLAAIEPTSSGTIYHQQGDAEMDFSLNHFVRTVSQNPGTHHQETQSYDPIMSPGISPTTFWGNALGFNFQWPSSGQGL